MPDSLFELSELIQTSVAPVFLLTGIAGLLSVMTHRLARIIDRTRVLEEDRPEGVNPFGNDELTVLKARMHVIGRAIALLTYSALLVASVIGLLFLGALLGYHLAPVVAVAFVIAMLLLIGGLMSFLGEVHLSIRQMRGPRASRNRPAS